MISVVLLIQQFFLWYAFADGTKLDINVQPEELKINDFDENDGRYKNNQSIEDSNNSKSHIILIYDNLTSNINDEDISKLDPTMLAYDKESRLANNNKNLYRKHSKKNNKQSYNNQCVSPSSINPSCNINLSSDVSNPSTRRSLIGKLLNLNPFRNENKSSYIYCNNNDCNNKNNSGHKKIKRKEIRELINRIKNKQPKYKGHLELLTNLENKLNDPVLRENSLISTVINVLNYVSRDNNLGLPPFINNIKNRIVDDPLIMDLNLPTLGNAERINQNIFSNDFLRQSLRQHFLSSNLDQNELFSPKLEGKAFNKKHPIRKNNTRNSGEIQRYKSGVKQYLNKETNRLNFNARNRLNYNNRNKRSKSKKNKGSNKQSSEVNKISKLQRKNEKKLQNSSTLKNVNDNEDKEEETITRRLIGKKHNFSVKKEPTDCETTVCTSKTTTETSCTEKSTCVDEDEEEEEATTECPESTTVDSSETTEIECTPESTETSTTTSECETTTVELSTCKKKKPKTKKPKTSTTCKTKSTTTTKPTKNSCEAEVEEEENNEKEDEEDEECAGGEEQEQGECEAEDSDSSTTTKYECKRKTTVQGEIEIIDIGDNEPNFNFNSK